MHPRRPGWLATLLLATSMNAASAHAAGSNTAIVPGAVWNDTRGQPINAHGAGLLTKDGVTYWYGENKGHGPGGNVARTGVSVYRSRDLLHWTPLGLALAVSADPHSDIASGAIIERPKVLYNAARHDYVMWFHLERAGHGYRDALIGVAVADRPEGPFRYLRSFRPNGQASRDMTLFQDDDGGAWVFYSSENNATMHVARLTDDYLGVRDGYRRIFVDQCLEAPAVFKSGGHYFFIGSTCTGWKPNAAHGAVADRVEGPWHEFGNPAEGADAGLTFHSQSAYVLPWPGHPGKFIYIGDRWRPQDPADGRYVWLPLGTDGKRFHIQWRDRWSPLRQTSTKQQHRDGTAQPDQTGKHIE